MRLRLMPTFAGADWLRGRGAQAGAFCSCLGAWAGGQGRLAEKGQRLGAWRLEAVLLKIMDRRAPGTV